jgi:hypothetical protein
MPDRELAGDVDVGDGKPQLATVREFATMVLLLGLDSARVVDDDGNDVTEDRRAEARAANPGWQPGVIPKVPVPRPKVHRSRISVPRPRACATQTRPRERRVVCSGDRRGPPSGGDDDPAPHHVTRRLRPSLVAEGIL